MMYRVRQPSKYGNRKYTLDGIEFDSKKEAARWAELRILEKAGKIEDLRRQVKFVLIPAQYEDSTDVYQRGANKGKPKKGKLIEHEAAYIADFVYRDKETDRTVVEDVKGCKISKAYDIFVIKRKLMLERYKIRIREV
jgi:hypothetical protein